MVIKSNLAVFGNEQPMKYYIIDLDLKFGLRIRLSVAETIQLGPNKREWQGHFSLCAEPPSFLPPAYDLPPPDALSLSSLATAHLLPFSFLLH